MPSGCSGVQEALRRRTSSRSSISQQEPSSRTAHGLGSLVGALRLQILPEGKRVSHVTAQNSLGATARSLVPRHWSAPRYFLAKPERVSILAPHCKPRLNCVPARVRRSYFSWASRIAESTQESYLGAFAPLTWARSWLRLPTSGTTSSEPCR